MKVKAITKRLLALLLTCLLIATLAACGSNGGSTPSASPTGSPSPGTSSSPSVSSPSGDNAAPPSVSSPAASNSSGSDRVLRITTTQDNGTLDPAVVSGTSYLEVMHLIYDVLFEYKLDGTIVWKLATGLDKISDTHYTLHLRQGVTFSNGNTFDANDVIFSMNVCRQDPRNMLQVKVIDFDKTAITDDYTIDLWLTQYDPSQFPGFTLLYIYDAESYDKQEIALHPIATGPYEVVNYVINSSLTLQARDGYWGNPPAIKKIEISVMDEDSQRVNAVATDATDMARIPTKDFDYLSSLGTYNVEISPMGVAASVAYFNCSTDGSTPLGTPEAREAVMYSIDRQAIVDLVYSGLGGVPNWPASSYGDDYEARFGNMDDTYSIGYNPDKAKALAEQEGLVGKTLRIITNGAPDFISMAEIIQNGLQAIGVNAEINNYDQASYNSIMADPSNFDIMLNVIGSSSRLAVDVLYNYPKFIPLGWTGPLKDEYMQLGEQANAIYDPVARGDAVYKMMQTFYKVQPWYALCESASVIAYSKDINGVEYYGSGYNIADWSFNS